MERDFQRLRIPDDQMSIVPDAHYMDLIVKRSDRLGLEVRRHPVLLPHDWFCACYKAGRVVFETLLVGAPGELQTYWQHHGNRPPLWQSCNPSHNLHSIPYALYGDDAGVLQKSKVLILMMHSCLCDSSTLERSMLLSVIPYEFVAEGITLEEVYEELAWSFQACEMGIHPRFDSQGQPLTGWRSTVGGVH